MDHIVGHIVRRGLDAHSALRASGGNDNDDVIEISAWSWALLASTAALFTISLFLVEYTYGNLIPTLSMIESPSIVLFEPIPDQETDLDKNGNDTSHQTNPELGAAKQTPITSSFRKTLVHLRQRAGCGSRFRGISIWLVYLCAFVQLSKAISFLNFIPPGVDAILASVLLANIRMAWTQIVITEPSEKVWFRRLPQLKLWRKVAIPTLIAATSQQVAIVMPIALLHVFGLYRLKPQGMGDTKLHLTVIQFIATFLVAIFCQIAVVLPAYVTLTRVQASLLSEEEETIVPFDRSFGGRVAPAVPVGAGVGMLDAWKTFDWNSRIRLLFIYFKVIVIETAVVISFMAVVAIQLHYIVGKENLQKYMEAWASGQ